MDDIKNSNLIEIYNNAISKETCEYFMKFFDKQQELGNTHKGVVGSGYKPESKDCDDLNILHPGQAVNDEHFDKYFNTKTHLSYVNEYEKTVEKYFWRYIKKYLINGGVYTHWQKLEQINHDFIERNPTLHGNQPLMHVYTPPGMGYHVFHADYAPFQEKLSRRMLVAMLYCNDVEEGGETEFWFQNIKIKPKQGTLVVWPAYFTHIHKGHPPISNKKYIVNKWLIANG
tara:strand:- start:154 stop:840 length:687 start_codon:yes stop_codon:yes gene_type:complete